MSQTATSPELESTTTMTLKDASPLQSATTVLPASVVTSHLQGIRRNVVNELNTVTPARRKLGNMHHQQNHDTAATHTPAQKDEVDCDNVEQNCISTAKVTPHLDEKEPRPDFDDEDDDSEENIDDEAAIDSDTLLKPEDMNNNEVREDALTSSSANTRGKNNNRVVSRRGRYLSPVRRIQNTSSVSSSPVNTKEPVVEYKTYRSPANKRDEEVPSLCSASSGHLGTDNKHTEKAPTTSISCDTAQETSPLASDPASCERRMKTERKNCVTFSPTTQSKLEVKAIKSPDRNFHSLPTLDGSKLLSPGGLLLSPGTPRKYTQFASEENKPECIASETGLKPSPKRDRERFVATPTDFALDYGKGHFPSSSFDNSNVLAWLQSPTANGFFSPGGYASILNTPQAGAPRTPRTPTVSTSFFFSDVAGLPRGDLTPKDGDNKKGQKGIICISPLATSKTKYGSRTNTPMNFKDMFASPNERAKVRSLPTLNDSPNNSRHDDQRLRHRSSSKDPSLDAVNMAERDMMEDEDLTVLLQLASNTPRSADRRKGHTTGAVFRSPDGKGIKRESSDNLPALQLPMIGNGRDDDDKSTPRLSKKPMSRDHDDELIGPPTLGMRTSSSTLRSVYSDDAAAAAAVRSSSVDTKSDKPLTKKDPVSAKPYHMPPPYHPHRTDSFYPHHAALPPGVSPNTTGSMRIVMGGPPPRTTSKSGTSSRPGEAGNPRYPDYYHPPRPGTYTYASGAYGYPPQRYYPPPPVTSHHAPLSNVQLPYTSAKTSLSKDKPVKTDKASAKRASTDKSPVGNKKQKKGTVSTRAKKKNRSPQITDPEERDKAAATIHAVNNASGKKNDKAAALAAAILRGVTQRPSGKWQAQLYFAGKSRYIGVFDTREKAALAYEIAREKLKAGSSGKGALCAVMTENLVNSARKAAFEGVNEQGTTLEGGMNDEEDENNDGNVETNNKSKKQNDKTFSFSSKFSPSDEQDSAADDNDFSGED